MKTTLNKIRDYSPCQKGWEKLLKHLGKTRADDEPLSLLTILDSNGLDDVLWCLRAVDGYDKEKRLYAVWCARQVQHLMTDQKSIKALDVAERHAHGQATDEDLRLAWNESKFAATAAKSEAAAPATSWAAAMTAARGAWAAVDAGSDADWGAKSEAAAIAAARAEQETEFRRVLKQIEKEEKS